MSGEIIAPARQGSTGPSGRRVELTVKEYAAQERVNERTVWRWLDKGVVKFRKTPGGGVRIIWVGKP